MRQATCQRGNDCSSVAMSSTRSPHGKSGNFSVSLTLNASAVMIKSVSARCKHDWTCSRPRVKFRFTGILPTKTHAKLATAAATPGGKTMATRRAGVAARRRLAMTQPRDNKSAPENSRRAPVRSMSAGLPPLAAKPTATSRPRCPRSEGRSEKASAVNCSKRKRVWACSEEGNGVPKTAAIGRGKCFGHLKKDLPPR